MEDQPQPKVEAEPQVQPQPQPQVEAEPRVQPQPQVETKPDLEALTTHWKPITKTKLTSIEKSNELTKSQSALRHKPTKKVAGEPEPVTFSAVVLDAESNPLNTWLAPEELNTPYLRCEVVLQVNKKWINTATVIFTLYEKVEIDGVYDGPQELDSISIQIPEKFLTNVRFRQLTKYHTTPPFGNDSSLQEWKKLDELVELVIEYQEAFASLVRVKPYAKEVAYPQFEQIDTILREKRKIVVYMRWNETIDMGIKLFQEEIGSTIDKYVDYYSKHPGKKFLQLNDWPGPEMRPYLYLPSQTVFGDIVEYQTKVGFARIEEYEELVKAKELSACPIHIRAVRIPNCMEYRYMTLANFPPDVTAQFNEGDEILIHLNYKDPPNDLEPEGYAQWKKDLLQNSWKMEFLGDVSWGRIGDSPGILYRKFDKKKGWDSQVIESVKHNHDNLNALAEAMDEAPVMKVHFSNHEANTVLARQLRDWGQIMKYDQEHEREGGHPWTKVFTGHDVFGHDSQGNPVVRNLYENVDKKNDSVYKKVLRTSSASQKEVIQKAATTMPGGKLLVLGPAGTGKTQLMINMILPVIREHKILVVARDNAQVDNLIKKIVERVRSDINLHNHTTIVRHHAETLETEAIFNRLKLIKEQREAKQSTTPTVTETQPGAQQETTSTVTEFQLNDQEVTPSNVTEFQLDGQGVSSPTPSEAQPDDQDVIFSADNHNKRCHNCGKEGHMARECQEPKTETRPCHNCGKIGHLSKNCPAPKKAKKRPSPYDTPWNTPEDDNLLKELMTSQLLKKKYDKVTKRFFGVGDRRYRGMDSSTGIVAFQLAAWNPDNDEGFQKHPLADAARHRVFRQHLEDYTNGAEFSSERKIQMKEAIKGLYKHVFEISKIVGVTPHHASDTMIQEYGPTLVCMDEFAALTDPQIWTIIAWYPNAIVLMFGDPDQIDPQVNVEGGLSEQLRLTLARRLMDLRHPYSILKEQHRMDQNGIDLSIEINPRYYGAMTLVEKKGKSPKTPETTTIETINHKLFGKAVNYMWMQQKGSTFVDNNHSRRNPVNVSVGMDYIIELLRVGFAAKDVKIITPYKSQGHLWTTALDNLRDDLDRYGLGSKKDEMEELSVTTVDGAQGKTFRFVILDTVNSESLGFMGNEKRLLVAMTRAEWGCLVIGDADGVRDHMKAKGRKPRTKYQQTFAYFWKRGWVSQQFDEPTWLNFCVPKQMTTKFVFEEDSQSQHGWDDWNTHEGSTAQPSEQKGAKPTNDTKERWGGLSDDEDQGYGSQNIEGQNTDW